LDRFLRVYADAVALVTQYGSGLVDEALSAMRKSRRALRWWQKLIDSIRDTLSIRVEVNGVRVSAGVSIRVAPVKEGDAAQNACLGPVPCHVGDTFRILVVVNVPGVAEEGG
jgi:hypothetical protein